MLNNKLNTGNWPLWLVQLWKVCEGNTSAWNIYSEQLQFIFSTT